MVTSGANQAFVNLVVTLVDAKDRVVLFAPYYFNHLMALQMTGAITQLVFCSGIPRQAPQAASLTVLVSAHVHARHKQK